MKKLSGPTNRACNGAIALDYWITDWISKIDRKTLDLGMPNRCILGQIFGDYTTGLDEIEHVLSLSEQIDLGFQACNTFDAISLTEAWKEEIKKRT